MQAVFKEAINRGCLEQVEQSFRNDHVEQIIQVNTGKSPAKVLEILLTSIKTHDGLHEIEKKMNTADFVNRVKAGHWIISGRTKVGSYPIIWIRGGLVNAGEGGFGSRRSLRQGTQEWYPALRASIYMYEMYVRHRTACKALAEGNALCYDMRGQGYMDGSIAYERVALDLIAKIFPKSMNEKIYVFGMSLAVTKAFAAAGKIGSTMTARKKNFVFLSRPEEAVDIADDKADVPDWVINYSKDAVKVTEYTIWGLSMFTKENNTTRVRHADIFKPKIGTRLIETQVNERYDEQAQNQSSRVMNAENAPIFAPRYSGHNDGPRSRQPALETIFSENEEDWEDE